MAHLKLDDRGVLIPCPSCATTNRLAYQTLDRVTRCGKCRVEIPPPSAPIDVTSATEFDRLIAAASMPVLVDFWAPWCGPCRVMAPELEKVARNVAGKALVVKVDTDGVPELGARFRIRSIPTIAVFRDGKQVTSAAGARPAADIQALLSSAPQHTT